MPTYEYACEACGKNWELEQRITEAAVKECPSCGEPKARRLISGSRFLLKGGGWYADGYGSSKSGGSTKSDDKGESTPSKPAESTKSEAKPAAASTSE